MTDQMTDQVTDQTRAPGTAGYGEAAEQLAVQYESVDFADIHRARLHLYPASPAAVLDIGAGTGRDAAALAALGHRVTAVEPTPELRAVAARLHPRAGIRWIADALPALPALSAEGEQYDLILLTAVWMHLTPAERPPAMGAVARLLAPGGRLSLTLRHGPVPPGRRMFDLPAADTITHARAHGLHLLHQGTHPDPHAREGVTWTELVLERGR